MVIPSYNEDLEITLNSLGVSVLDNIDECELILVFNHGEREKEELKAKHQQQYEKYSNLTLDNGLKVRTIAAFNLPYKHAGVGLARKIGMDEALSRFAEVDYDGLIVCLDGDCQVSPNYLPSLLKAESERVGGMSLYYEHPLQEVKDEQDKEAIINYEIFSRYYSLGLKWANYPFPFQTVGSSMASRASHYAKIGGMNRRKAGEDFYFLHKLFPQGRFKEWTDCTVYPSARKSDRVPFGTGKAMLAMEAGEKNYEMLYNPQIFIDLKTLFENLPDLYASNKLDGGLQYLETFLKANTWKEELTALKKRSTNYKQFHKNFFYWFDGFKVLKFIHYAQEGIYKDLSNIKACKALLDLETNHIEDLLTQLRALEKENPLSYV